MCGFVGTFPLSGSITTEAVRESLQTILHRGPDAHRVEIAGKSVVGHARLSILDVSDGHQPMQRNGRWIVFNGEIYNYHRLKQQVPASYQTDSDTEVILHLYEQFGPDVVTLLDGMFSFAIVSQDYIFLARDPLGIKPLYYVVDEEGDDLHFASEIKALLHLQKEIREFPAGHFWCPGQPMQRYFTAPDALWRTPQEPFQSKAAARKAVYTMLREAVHKRLIADPDVPVGVSLSGGLDSSIVAALAAEVKHPLDTFAVGVSGSEDLRFSHQVADYLGTRHHTQEYAFDDMLAALPAVIYHLESYDAALVRSAIPNYFLARLASQVVKVILTGEGADELFAGYAYLRGLDNGDDLNSELRTITLALHNTNLQRADRMAMAFGLEGRVPFLDVALVNLAFQLPPEWKQPDPVEGEKMLLRQAFEGLLPGEVLYRPKQKFSAGAGSAGLLEEYAHEVISDREYRAAGEEFPEAGLRSKEELLYYRIFLEKFGGRVPPRVVGRTRSIVASELS